MDPPDVEGVEIMAWMSRNHSTIPCIAMLEPGQARSWFNEPEAHQNILYFIEKPLTFESPAEMIG